MQYDIKLKIEYDYAGAAGTSRHLVRLMPCDIAAQQRLIAGRLNVSPTPDEWETSGDFFGNSYGSIGFFGSHDALEFSVLARVERFAVPPIAASRLTRADLSGQIAAVRTLTPHSPLHFTVASTRVSIDPEITRYARALIDDGMDVVAVVEAVGSAIFSDFTFNAEATTVDTSVSEAFAGRHGVCQDFAHIMIACLRGLGIPARYVSGLLRTKPPEGAQRLEGADAMHAWVSAWCGNGLGWVEFDPTNNTFVAQDHITIAYGRDYFDVAPVKGVLRTAGHHQSKQSVDVIALAPGRSDAA